jgi:hypothetical protein
MQIIEATIAIGWKSTYRRKEEEENSKIQAGAELCQAQVKLG